MAKPAVSKAQAPSPRPPAARAPERSQSAPTSTDAGSRGASDRRGLKERLWPLLTAVAVTLVLITLPRLPLGSDDDSSWGAVLGYAHQHGLQFGKDLAFTYGPLGFLITPYACPQAPGLRLLADIVLSFTSVAGLCLVAWRLGRVWRGVLLMAFLFLAGNADPRSELLLNVGLLSWTMLGLVETGRAASLSMLMLVALSIFAALAKVTYLFIAPLCLAALAADLLLRGRTRSGLLLPAGFMVGLTLTWVLLGQSLLHLLPFLRDAFVLSSGYDQAMQTKEFSTLTWTALLMLAAAWAATGLRSRQACAPTSRNFRWRRRVLLLWFTLWLFLIWKHGFVRAGRDHTEIFLGCVPLLALILEALPGAVSTARHCARGLALACLVLSVFGWQWLLGGDLKACLVQPFKLAGEHARILRHPGAHATRLREMQAAENSAMQLPRLRERLGPASVDVFGFNQSFAVFNGMNYRPRPVFQSYAAFSSPLMRLNEQFYASPAAPQYVLFRLNAIDDRFPPLEDATLFRDLLLNYTPVDAEGPFLLLKSRQPGRPPPQLELLYEGVVHPSELIDLRSYGNTDLWLEVNLQPSLTGRARTLLYQAPRVQLGVWCSRGASLRMAKFRAPDPMLAAGFLASPLQLDNQDVLDLFTGASITRPVAYSVELDPGSQDCWKDTIGFRVYRIRSRLGRCAPAALSRLLKYPGFGQAPAAVVSSRQAIIQVEGKPALFLPPGSYMRFAVPAGAKRVSGFFGFAPASYALGGATDGAEFHIDEELPDGRMQSLGTYVLQPHTKVEDRGLKQFELECPGNGDRQLLFRILPVGVDHPAWDLTCWGGITFK